MRPQTEVSVVVDPRLNRGLPVFRWKNLVLALVGLSVIYLGARGYQAIYGWSKGLDAFAPEFEFYWMNFLYAELALEAAVAALLWGWLWKTRDRQLEEYWMHLLDREAVLERVRGKALKQLLSMKLDRSLAPMALDEELRRNLTHLVWLAAYAWALYWGLSFFTEQDATWHQTVIRDTDFTPSHIVVFYLSYPIYIITGGGAFLYAKTRLPYFVKGLSIPYLMLVVGPFMILPNVGLNEWGHTFWFMEEVFAASLHWGFVVLGWFALSILGVLLQVFASVLFLIKEDLLSSS
ncbi:hypothetical protein JCM13664_21490 [Methylothermus subterraneus]|nr:methane monooxygenase, C subunit [uncultured Gammaproteobacteria bacterium]